MKWARVAAIGRGSSASVCLAVAGANLIAVKSVPASNSSVLQHEESVLWDLQGCPQIVSCFGHDVTGESYNLLLEYIPGGPLSELGAVPKPQISRYAKSILQGLSFIHGSGYVHCDIKPQNILICDDGINIKIADFGLAKKKGVKLSAGTVRGTPLYMSPESICREEFEAPMDVWALGCVVAHMATGGPAWGAPDGGGIWDLMMRIGFGCETPEIPLEMSEEGKDFLMKCFVRDPEKRWTADMLLDHPFVTDLEVEGNSKRMSSPRSVFGLSICDFDLGCHGSMREDEAFDSEIGIGCSSSFSVKERIGMLATEERIDWWGSPCSSDGWICVREGCLSSVEDLVQRFT